MLLSTASLGKYLLVITVQIDENIKIAMKNKSNFKMVSPY
ncbi:hypothetical protein SOJ_00390 [Staphylococcus sp. OJ82]|nr:hypothetical protein SOJ_00390 [Staphylococcus sp. OJ82]